MPSTFSRSSLPEPRRRRTPKRSGLEPIAARLTKELILARCRAMRAANAERRARMAAVLAAHRAQQRRLGLSLDICSDRTVH